MNARVKPGNSSEILLSYRGRATDDSITCLLELAEHKLQQQKLARSTQKKLFKILVETLQNAYLHIDGIQSKKDFPIEFSLKRDNYTYTVSAGNHVRQSKVGPLRTVLDRFNGMPIPELRKYYVNKLKHGKMSSQGGAGLGFVDIIRRSGEKISYSFKPVNKDYSYFSLQVKVSA